MKLTAIFFIVVAIIATGKFISYFSFTENRLSRRFHRGYYPLTEEEIARIAAEEARRSSNALSASMIFTMLLAFAMFVSSELHQIHNGNEVVPKENSIKN